MKTVSDKLAARMIIRSHRALIGILAAAAMTSSAFAQTTYTWDNSNVTGVPPAALDWFTGGPNSLGLWTGTAVPVSSNTTVIKFFQDTTTALLNTNAPSTQAVNLNNGGSAFELGTLTLSGKASATANANLTMNSSGDALNFSAATGTVNLDAVNNATRTITYNVANNIQLGTSSSAGALTFTGGGSSAFNFSGAISELQVGGGSVIKSGNSALTLSGTSSFTGGLTVNAGTLTLATSQGFTGGVDINGGTLAVNVAQGFTGGITLYGGNLLPGNSASTFLGANVVTFVNSATVNGPNGIGGGGAYVLPIAVINSGATATIYAVGSAGNGYTFTGGVSGSGVLRYTGGTTGPGNGKSLTLNNSSGFTGTLLLDYSIASTGIILLNFSALGDGGKLQWGKSSGQSQDLPINYSGAGMTFNNRQLEMVGSRGVIMKSSGTGPLVFNAALSVTAAAVGGRNLTLSGTYTGVNAFNGVITNGASATVGVSKIDACSWILGNTNNTYTGGTTVSAGTLGFASGAMGLSGTINASGGTLLWVPGNTQDISSRLTMGAGTTSTFDTGGNNVIFASAIGSSTNGAFSKRGLGALTLNGVNTYTGATTVTGGGTLILDYGATNDNKIAGILTLAGGALTMKGATGDHVEEVTSTSLSAGGSFLTRDGANTAKLRMNAITRAAGGTISFGSDTLADTDTLNANGILGGWATLGDNWAVSVDSGVDANTNVTAFGTVTALPTTGGANTGNYTLTGAQNQGGAVLANTVKLIGSGTGDTLALGVNNLTITYTSATSLGGILYTGGGDGNYNITGTGKILTSSTTGELIITATAGTLTVSAPIVTTAATAGILTKTGAGTLVVDVANSYTGITRVNQGVLRLRNNTAAGAPGGGITVQNGAALELANNITIGAEALAITGSGISSGGALRNVSGANTYQGAITIGNGGARINNDDTGNALTVRGITTALFADVTFGGAGNITHNTAISGAGGVVKDGTGTLTMNIANTYSGTTTINEGVLALGVAGALPAGNNVVLAGGTLSTGGAAANVASTLTLAANSTIELGAGTLSFTGGVGDWSAFTLNLTGTLGPTSLRFVGGLTQGQLDSITYNGGPVRLDDDGYVVSNAPAGTVLILR